MFTTCVYAILDTEQCVLHLANAGHNYPFWVRADGSSEELENSGFPLGIVSGDMVYEPQTVNLQSGDVVVYFTDGITEAMRSDETMFGDIRLEKVICENRSLSAEQLCQKIYDEVLAFVGDADRSDDMIMLILKAH